MRKLFCWLMVGLLGFSSVLADESTIQRFIGGDIDGGISLYNTLFVGMGSEFGSGSQQGHFTGFGIHGINTNPAHLAYLQRRQLVVDYIPRFNINSDNLYDFNNELDDEIDNAFADYDIPEGNLVSPNFSGAYEQKGGFFAFAGVIPYYWQNRIWAIGASVYKPFSMNLNFNGNGLEALAETVKSMGGFSQPIQLQTNLDFNFEARVDVLTANLAFATAVTPWFNTGMTLEYHHIQMKVDGVAKIDGIMSTAGLEFYFNDPNDPHIDFENGEQNDLNQYINGQYDGQYINIRWGNSLRVNQNLFVDATFNFAPEFTLDGDLTIVQNNIAALNTDVLFGDEEGDFFDPEKLDLAKLTLTERVEHPENRQLTFSTPSSLTVGLAYQLAFIRGFVNSSFYFTDFSVRYLKDDNQEVTVGLKYKYGLRAGLDFRIFRLDAGVIMADEVHEGFAGDDEYEPFTDLPLFQAAIGTGFRFLKHYRFDVVAFLTPTPLLKTAFSFDF
ncbi:hypothetical protein KAH55_10450 [bacterium]|nr:hypothetical protein [bacterium]